MNAKKRFSTSFLWYHRNKQMSSDGGDLKWFKITKRQPESITGHDIDVIVKIEGLSMTASEYDEYRVVKWRPKLNCFIEWENGIVIKYNDKPKPPGAATVTRWAYFNKCED